MILNYTKVFEIDNRFFQKGIYIKASSIRFLFWVIILRLTLDYCYSAGVSPIYAYMGFKSSPTVSSTILSWFILIILYFFANNCFVSCEKMSDEILFMLFLLSVTPFTTLIQQGQFEYRLIIYFTIYWVAIFIFHTILNNRVKRPSLQLKIASRYNFLNLLFLVLFFFSAAIVIFITGYYSHFRLSFDLVNVYEQRLLARTYNLPTILSYLFSATKGINPIYIWYFMRKKKFGLMLLAILIQLLIFGYDGSKSVFFIMIFVIGVNLLPKFDANKLNRMISVGLPILIFVCLLLFLLFEEIYPLSVFVRRELLLTQLLQKCYFSFFTEHVPDYFKGSFLKLFGATTQYPNLSRLIGYTYFGAKDMSANNGLISEAITNLGAAGAVVMPLILCTFLWLFDSVSSCIDYRLIFCISFYIANLLMNSFLFTALLTHGLLLMLVLLLLINSTSESD